MQVFQLGVLSEDGTQVLAPIYSKHGTCFQRDLKQSKQDKLMSGANLFTINPPTTKINENPVFF